MIMRCRKEIKENEREESEEKESETKDKLAIVYQQMPLGVNFY